MTRVEWAMNMMRDEHFKAVMEELRQAEIQKFSASNPLDIDTREEAYRRVRCLHDLQSHIEGIAMTAQIKEKRWKVL